MPNPPDPDRADSTATPQAASTTSIARTEPISLWKKVKQVCGAGALVDSFGADSFDEDAGVLNVNEDAGGADEDEDGDEAALGGGFVGGRGGSCE